MSLMDYFTDRIDGKTPIEGHPLEIPGTKMTERLLDVGYSYSTLVEYKDKVKVKVKEEREREREAWKKKGDNIFLESLGVGMLVAAAIALFFSAIAVIAN